MGIDDPITLSELLDAHDLRDLMLNFTSMHGVPVSVIERQEVGPVLIATSAALEDDLTPALDCDLGPLPGADHDGSMLYVTPILHQGEMIAKVAVGPYRLPLSPAWREGAGEFDSSPGEGYLPVASLRSSVSLSDPGERGGQSRVILDERQAGSVARHIASVLELLVHNAYARFMISTLHTEAMKASFDEITAKNQHLEKAVERMQEVDRLKSTFLATMSHELRTPLTSVIGYSEMLIEGLAGKLENEQREYVKTILSKAEHLLQLITGILDLSMLESGSVELRRDPVILLELVESVIATVLPTVRRRRIKLQKPTFVLPHAIGDRQKIREIVRNLLTNAIKFTPEGGQIDVALALGPLRPEELDSTNSRDLRQGVQVTITDSGIGMSPDEQAHIFDPFYQVDSSSTRRYGGSGLGLTLAKRYAEALGGSIWVDSTPGSGSSFTVTLPMLPEDRDDQTLRKEGTPERRDDQR